MGGRGKYLLAGALAALLLLGLAACGGGGTGTDGTTAATTTGETEKTTGGGEGSTEERKGEDDDGSGGSSGEGSSNQGDDSGGDDSGGNSDFDVPGGDNSIQNFGSEADDAEREEVSETVKAFLEARSAKDWDGVCTYLAAAVVEPIEKLVENNPRFKDADCSELLAAIGKQAKGLENNMAEPVGSFRVKGKKGFALYHGTEGEDFAMPMDKEGGDWKVGALEPAPLA